MTLDFEYLIGAFLFLMECVTFYSGYPRGVREVVPALLGTMQEAALYV